MGNSTPQMTSAQLAIKEVEHYCENIKSIYDIAVNVCPFLPAVEKSLALDIGKVLLDKSFCPVHKRFLEVNLIFQK